MKSVQRLVNETAENSAFLVFCRYTPSGRRFTYQATDRKSLGTRKFGFRIGAEERNGRNWLALECPLLFAATKAPLAEEVHEKHDFHAV